MLTLLGWGTGCYTVLCEDNTEWSYGHQAPHFCNSPGCYCTSERQLTELGEVYWIAAFQGTGQPSHSELGGLASLNRWELSSALWWGGMDALSWLGVHGDAQICLGIVLYHTASLPSTLLHWLSSSLLAGKSSSSLLWPCNTFKAPPRALKD